MNTAVARTLEDLKTSGALSGIDVANMASVSKATVSRWSSGKAAPHPGTQLILSDLRYVVDKLQEFYAPDEVRAWLYAKHPMLGGAAAMDLIHDGQTEQVLEAIESLANLTYL